MKARKQKSVALSRQKVERILSQFSKRKILIFGDVGVDKYTIGTVSRISPEAPIPIVEVAQTELKLGLAANVADNIAALDAEPYLVGLVGKDHSAHDFSLLMKQRKMTTKFLIQDNQRKTTVKERVVAESQQVVRIDHESRAPVKVNLIKGIWQKIEKALKDVDAVIIEDYAKGLVEMSICHQLIQVAEQKNIPVFVDPNSKSPLHLYYGCTVITPNLLEAEGLSGVKINDLRTLKQAGNKILDQINGQIVIITRGKEGMAVFIRGKEDPVLIPTFAREVFDVSGAGDTTIATLALAWASGADIIEAAFLANSAAGVVVGKRGTATVGRSELRGYVEFVLSWQKRNKRK